MLKAKEMDLTQGNLFKQIIIFSLPILAIHLLQLFFNTADTFVLGIFLPEEIKTAAVGGVGATNSITNLLTTLFIGIGMGCNIVISKAVGNRDIEKVRKCVGTSVLLALVSGVFLAIVGFFGARQFLIWMNCKDALLDKATIYLKIYCLGLPIYLLYNYEAAILRAVGETLKPLYFLLIGGILNVILNIFLVVVLKMDADGVAIATVASNAVSAICCFITLLKNDGMAKLEIKNIRFNKEIKEILGIGLQTGVSKVMFAVSNIIVASSINSFGTITTTGNTVAHTFEQYITEVGSAFSISLLSFVSQNIGANNYKRAFKSLSVCLVIVVSVQLIVCSTVLIMNKTLYSVISKDESVLEVALLRMRVVTPFYLVVGLYQTFDYFLRAFDKNKEVTAKSIFCGFVFRIAWIEMAKAVKPGDLKFVFLSYPLTWCLDFLLAMALFVVVVKKIKKSSVNMTKELKEN
ncbi:MAG: MATE family efflux transporter [Clostridia bacterium]|nr:MATE family efflux transporter [Clostridia bacterium]